MYKSCLVDWQVRAVTKEGGRCAVPAIAGAELQEVAAPAGVHGLAGERHERCSGGGSAAGREQACCKDNLLVDIAGFLADHVCR